MTENLNQNITNVKNKTNLGKIY